MRLAAFRKRLNIINQKGEEMSFNTTLVTVLYSQVIAKLTKPVCNLELKKGRIRVEHECKNKMWTTGNFGAL